jgi:hypothetical protein
MPSPSPTPAPIIIDTTNPTNTPSSSPEAEDETNFPSILTAIVGPTMSNSKYEGVPPEEAATESNTSASVKQSHSYSLNLLACAILVMSMYSLLV